MKKFIVVIIIIAAAGGIVWFINFYRNNLAGIWPSLKPPSQNISKIIQGRTENQTNFPLSLPAGFGMSIFADNIPGARDMVEDDRGNVWVSQTSEGTITLLETENGRVTRQGVAFRGLQRPHGLAFDPGDPGMLYIAEENRVSRVRVYTEMQPEKILDLPGGGRHYTRSILFHDGKLLVSIGSSCDVCVEKDQRRGSIIVANKDGSDARIYASGLRNAVFMTEQPGSANVYATEMGRDFLGDNLPPDEINKIEDGKNYGWPYCYGDKVLDRQFDPKGEGANFCSGTMPPVVQIPAHSAPLGLAFFPNSWPKEYAGDLLVAYHGSWNRSVPTGYKVVRYQVDQNGNLISDGTDFISGWLQGNSALGRPVGILITDRSRIFISDDKAGVVYALDLLKS